MRGLVVLVLVAIAQSAPIQEEPSSHVAGNTAEDMDHSISKRTEEQIFFGNHQNEPRVKKSDPAVDPKGVVRALPAAELEEVKETPVASPIEKQPEETSEQEVEPELVEKEEIKAIEKTEGQPAVEKVVEKEKVIEPSDKNVPEEDVLAESELLKAEPPIETPIPEGVTEEGEGSGEVPAPETPDEMTYDYIMKLYNEAEERLPQEYYYPNYYLNYRKKRDAEENVVKRNHRAKRDLGYGDFEDSYYPAAYEENQYYNQLMRKRETEEALDDAVARELAPLLENYEGQEGDFRERYDTPKYLEYYPDSSESYERWSPYDDSWDGDEDGFGALSRPGDISYRTLFRSQPTSFLPIKRQAMSFVPGIRRRRFNYPHSEEPESHWGAFVDTEKRDEEEAYERLYRLARALASRRSSYTPYWEDDEYKKK